MANEIHSLKIGDVEYPIYSEGIKLDTAYSNSDYFLTTTGNSGNRKLGVSTAINGNSSELSISSNFINIGSGYDGFAPTVVLGDNASTVYIGGGSTNPVTIHIGAGNDGEAPSNIKMGTPNGSIEIGDSADLVEVGDSATELRVGNYGTTVGIGNSAEEVNIGRMSYGVNIGNQCEGNVVIADGSVWTYEDEDGNEIIEKTTSTFIGENNYEVNIGASASGVVVGPGAKTINIGSTATDYLSILSYGRINIDSNHGDVDITSENCDINIVTLGSDGVDNGCITIEAERDANMVAHGNINIDATYGDGETTGFVNINAEGNVGISSGVGEVNILADTGISLEASNNNIDITSTLGQINIVSGQDMNIDTSNGYDINIGHNSYDVDISGNYIYIGNAGQAENTNNIYIESSNIYIAGTTKVYPYECTDTALNTGFSVLRPDNNDVGVVFCAPSQAKGGMVILPKNAYNSTSNVVNLGNTSKRFSGLFVVSGRATNGFTTDSDERLKDFGDDIAVDLDALAALRKSYYRWNETSGFENEKDRMLGMSAQEVQKIYPELVDADENGMLSMAYDRLSVVALAAIDKLHETNKELKAENDELKDRIANLENLVNAILSRIN